MTARVWGGLCCSDTPSLRGSGSVMRPGPCPEAALPREWGGLYPAGRQEGACPVRPSHSDPALSAAEKSPIIVNSPPSPVVFPNSEPTARGRGLCLLSTPSTHPIPKAFLLRDSRPVGKPHQPGRCHQQNRWGVGDPRSAAGALGSPPSPVLWARGHVLEGRRPEELGLGQRALSR